MSLTDEGLKLEPVIDAISEKLARLSEQNLTPEEADRLEALLAKLTGDATETPNDRPQPAF